MFRRVFPVRHSVLAATQNEALRSHNSFSLSNILPATGECMSHTNNDNKIEIATGPVTSTSRPAGRVLVTLSIGNRYYSNTNIATAIKHTMNHVCREGGAVSPWVPTRPAEKTFEALGYHPLKCARLARQNTSRILRAADAAGLASCESGMNATYKPLTWDDMTQSETHPAYVKLLGMIRTVYEDTNSELRADLRHATKEVLSTKKGLVDVSSDQIDIGVEYVLCELGCLLAAPELLQTPEVLFIYHRPWPVLSKAIDGKYDGVAPTTGLSFDIFNNEVEK